MGRVENVVGKGENADFQHFLLFLQCFQKASYTESLKVVIVWLRVTCCILPPLHKGSRFEAEMSKLNIVY